MKRNRALMSYYKQKLYGGRSSFARAVDYISLRLILFLLCYVHFSGLISNLIMAGLMSLLALAFGSVALELIKSIRLDRFIRQERAAIAQDAIRKKIQRMPREEQLETLRAYAKNNPQAFAPDSIIFIPQKTAPLSQDDVLAAVHAAKKRSAKGVTLLHKGTLTPQAQEMARECKETTVSFLGLEQILSLQDRQALTPSPEEIDEIILERVSQLRQRKKEARSRPFGKGRVRRYIYCAIGLMIASFFVGYPIYYRLMSAMCISFGAIAYAVNQADTPAGG